MNALTAVQQAQLGDMFGRWVSFDYEERRIYSHDVGAIPKLIKPIIGRATAAAVVQPASEEELIQLVHWAGRNKVHLVPRAKATSGYGGVMPVTGGISVSLTRMKEVLAVDREAMSARVQPGVVWNALERDLEKAGLALRTYPSSAPSSTVGGWLAQGGVGYGCFEYGAFLDSVIAARVVLPNGEVRTFEGEDLKLISEAEGITGFITEVTVRVREKAPETMRVCRFASMVALAQALNELMQSGIPLWSVSFINPTMATLRNRLPPRLEHGQPVLEQHPRLPEEGYTVMLVAPAARWDATEQAIARILDKHAGEVLDEALAAHEWGRWRTSRRCSRRRLPRSSSPSPWRGWCNATCRAAPAGWSPCWVSFHTTSASSPLAWPTACR
jgi:FAD/FMN-containing dehydrogenase